MEQTTLAGNPDIPIAVRYDLTNPPYKLAIAVSAVVSECFGRWVKPVQAAVFGAKPKSTATVLSDALDRSTTETVWVLGVMNIAGTAFGKGVEFVYPRCW